jgi:Rho GTPase-activating protein 18/28/40
MTLNHLWNFVFFHSTRNSHALQTCSTGSRSRSATPEDLDSLESLPDVQDVTSWQNTSHHQHHSQIPRFTSIFDNSTSSTTIGHQSNGSRAKQNLRRTPSAPMRAPAELFRGSHIRCDIPCFTAEGIELLNFQRLGTIHIPRVRSGSDPSCTIG